jgi:hypothetical protein
MAATAGVSSSVGRDVVYRIRFEVDQSARTAGDQAAKLAEQAFSRAERAKKKEANEHKKAIDAQIKEVEAYIKKVDEAANLYATANAKQRAANMQFVASTKQALEGVTQLGRSFVLLGISSEKDLAKAAKALAGFEAGANLIRGTINVLESATKAWSAYGAAVTAAGVASAAGAALSAGAGAAGAGKAGGGIVGDVATSAAGEVAGGVVIGGGAVAGGAKAAGAAKAIGTAIGAAIATPAFIAIGLSAGLITLGEAALFRDDNKGMGYLGQAVMKIPGYRNLAESVGAGWADSSGINRSQRNFGVEQNWLRMQAERQAGQQAIEKQFAMRQAESTIATALRSDGTTAGNLQSTRNAIGALGGAGMGEALGGGTALLDRTIALRERERELVIQIAQEQKAAHQDQIRALETELQKQQRIAETIRGQLSTAAERFGQLGAADQQRAIAAQQRLDAGQNLSREDRQRLRAIGLDSTTAGVRAQDIADAERAGFSKFFGKDERRQLNQAIGEENRIKVAIQRERNFVVQVESNVQAEATALAQEVAKLMAERDEQLKKLFAEELRKYLDNYTESRNKDAALAYAVGG